MVEQCRVHGRDALEHGEPIALDDLERPARIEARNQGEAGAGTNACLQAAGLTERVKQGQRAEDQFVLVAPPDEVGDAAGVPPEPSVRELDALRPPGRPRRVQDDRGVVRPANLVRHVSVAHLCQEPIERVRFDDDARRTGLPRAGSGDLLELMPRKQTFAPESVR
jgi:hypothetical protein